jgi:hypothetical protein
MKSVTTADIRMRRNYALEAALLAPHAKYIIPALIEPPGGFQGQPIGDTTVATSFIGANADEIYLDMHARMIEAEDDNERVAELKTAMSLLWQDCTPEQRNIITLQLPPEETDE